MNTYKRCLEFWNNNLLELRRGIKRLENDDGEIVEKLEVLNSYVKDIYHFEELEQELPNWLVDEMEKFFKQLEKVSLNPHDYWSY